MQKTVSVGCACCRLIYIVKLELLSCSAHEGGDVCLVSGQAFCYVSNYRGFQAFQGLENRAVFTSIRNYCLDF